MRTARKLLIALLIVLLLALIGGGIAWTILNNGNAARPEAVAALSSDAAVTVSRPAGEDWYVFTPTAATPTTGLILYPALFLALLVLAVNLVGESLRTAEDDA